MSDLTFEQMLEESFKTIHAGEVVEGTVIDVKPEEIRRIIQIKTMANDLLGRIVEFLIIKPVYTAKVRYSRFSADTSSTEENNSLTLRYPLFQYIQLSHSPPPPFPSEASYPVCWINPVFHTYPDVVLLYAVMPAFCATGELFRDFQK